MGWDGQNNECVTFFKHSLGKAREHENSNLKAKIKLISTLTHNLFSTNMKIFTMCICPTHTHTTKLDFHRKCFAYDSLPFVFDFISRYMS